MRLTKEKLKKLIIEMIDPEFLLKIEILLSEKNKDSIAHGIFLYNQVAEPPTTLEAIPSYNNIIYVVGEQEELDQLLEDMNVALMKHDVTQMGHFTGWNASMKHLSGKKYIMVKI